MPACSLASHADRRTRIAADQELDQAGEWESLLAAAGLINSPADYEATGGGSSGSGGSQAAPAAGKEEGA